MKETDKKKKKAGLKEKEEESEGMASGVLKGLADIIPGLGGLLKGLEKSEAFQERLRAINEEVDRKLREEPLKRAGTPRVRTSFTTRTLTRDRTPFRRKTEESMPKPKEPVVDLFDEEDHLMVIVELPGVAEKEIRVNLKDNKLIIAAHTADRRYHKEIDLPCSVKGELGKVYRNGVLEIRIEKASEKGETHIPTNQPKGT